MESFREAYGVLQRHAQTLRNQDEPNIDDLLTIVTESVNAYKVCKQRIDAVESALKTACWGDGSLLRSKVSAGVHGCLERSRHPAARLQCSSSLPTLWGWHSSRNPRIRPLRPAIAHPCGCGCRTHR